MSIDDVIGDLDIRVHPFALCDLVQNQPLHLEDGRSSMLHYVLAGKGELILDQGRSLSLSTGQLVLIPGPIPHVVRSSVHRCETVPLCRPINLGLRDLQGNRIHGQDTALLVLCSHVDLTIGGIHNVLHQMNNPISTDISARLKSVNLTFALLDELTAPSNGSKIIVESLMRIATIQLLREELLNLPEFLSTLSVCREPKIMPAVDAILKDPRGLHTVDSLARSVAMSRSSFASKFKSAIGMGPMEFLRRHRVDIAARELEHPSSTVERASEAAGFSSRSAFSRAFRDIHRMSPREFKDLDPL